MYNVKLLSERAPHLRKEFDSVNNNGIKFEDLRTDDKREFYWTCSKDKTHIFKAIVRARINHRVGMGCGYCSKHLLTPERSLTTRFPDVAKELHPTKNNGLTGDDISYGSGKKFWFLCPYGHSYYARVQDRTINKSGCSVCAGHFQSPISVTHPELLKSWSYQKNEISPQDITFGTGTRVWWKCDKNHPLHEWLARPNKFMKYDCRVCAGFYQFGIDQTHPELAKEFHPTKNGQENVKDITAGCRIDKWWLCAKCNHEWQAEPKVRALDNHGGCSRCNGYFIDPITITHPERLSAWHPIKNGKIKPEDYTAGSSKKIWWVCLTDSSHPAWQSSIQGFVQFNRGCSTCGRESNTVIGRFRSWLDAKADELQKSDFNQQCLLLNDSGFLYTPKPPSSIIQSFLKTKITLNDLLLFKDNQPSIIDQIIEKHLQEPHRSYRQTIPQKIRELVFKRDNYQCQNPYCSTDVNSTKRQATLSIDHKVPVTRGGLDEIMNYQTLCCSCNSKKKDKTMEEFLKWQKA